MSTPTSSTMPSSTSSTKAPSKNTAKKSKKIVLRLSPDLLAQFPSHSPPLKPLVPKKHSASTFTPAAPSPSVQAPEPSITDKSSESNATPLPSDAPDTLKPPPKTDSRRSRGGGVSGRKRAPPALDPDKPRGRPGPKKKPRLADGTIDHSSDATLRTGAAPTSTTNPIPAHKLGPKANTGAINAGLRALDRTGKPCRKWHKTGLQLKSFTGSVFAVPSWRASQKDRVFGGSNSGDGEKTSTGSSDIKDGGENEDIGGSSAVSDRSNSGDGEAVMKMDTGIDSSPAPAIVA